MNTRIKVFLTTMVVGFLLAVTMPHVFAHDPIIQTGADFSDYIWLYCKCVIGLTIAAALMMGFIHVMITERIHPIFKWIASILLVSLLFMSCAQADTGAVADDALHSLISLLSGGSQYALLGFGIWIAWKVTLTLTISISIVSAIKCLIKCISRDSALDTLHKSGHLAKLSADEVKEIFKV